MVDISNLSAEESEELKRDPRTQPMWSSYDEELKAMLIKQYEQFNGIEQPAMAQAAQQPEGAPGVIAQLVTARRKAGLTQQQLADEIGLSQSALARLESPLANPSLKNIIKIANALGVSVKIS